MRAMRSCCSTETTASGIELHMVRRLRARRSQRAIEMTRATAKTLLGVGVLLAIAFLLVVRTRGGLEGASESYLRAIGPTSDEKDTAIVFVHGVFGDGEDTFKSA